MKTKPLVYKTSPGSLELRLELLARELYFRSDGGVISKIIADKGEHKTGYSQCFSIKNDQQGRHYQRGKWKPRN